jgi:hypothetical protein
MRWELFGEGIPCHDILIHINVARATMHQIGRVTFDVHLTFMFFFGKLLLMMILSFLAFPVDQLTILNTYLLFLE